MQNKRQLWLKVVQGDMRTLSHPQRVQKSIIIAPDQRLVGIDRFLLSLGTFAGRSKACHLRLKSLHDAPPQFCLRYDGACRWTIVGLGGSVFVNEELVCEETLELKHDDEIICDPYIFRVVPRPNAQQSRDRSAGAREIGPSSPGESSFILNLPPPIPERTACDAPIALP